MVFLMTFHMQALLVLLASLGGHRSFSPFSLFDIHFSSEFHHGIQGTRRVAQPSTLSRTVEVTLSRIPERRLDFRCLHDCGLWASVHETQGGQEYCALKRSYTIPP
jgi:hypothetical protein